MKLAIVSAGGHEAVLRAMENHPTSVDIQLAGCKLLCNVVESVDARVAMEVANAALKNHAGNDEVFEAATSLVGLLLEKIGS
jgi:hypothetical protein